MKGLFKLIEKQLPDSMKKDSSITEKNENVIKEKYDDLNKKKKDEPNLDKIQLKYKENLIDSSSIFHCDTLFLPELLDGWQEEIEYKKHLQKLQEEYYNNNFNNEELEQNVKEYHPGDDINYQDPILLNQLPLEENQQPQKIESTELNTNNFNDKDIDHLSSTVKESNLINDINLASGQTSDLPANPSGNSLYSNSTYTDQISNHHFNPSTFSTSIKEENLFENIVLLENYFVFIKDYEIYAVPYLHNVKKNSYHNLKNYNQFYNNNYSADSNSSFNSSLYNNYIIKLTSSEDIKVISMTSLSTSPLLEQILILTNESDIILLTLNSSLYEDEFHEEVIEEVEIDDTSNNMNEEIEFDEDSLDNDEVKFKKNKLKFHKKSLKMKYSLKIDDDYFTNNTQQNDKNDLANSQDDIKQHNSSNFTLINENTRGIILGEKKIEILWVKNNSKDLYDLINFSTSSHSSNSLPSVPPSSSLPFRTHSNSFGSSQESLLNEKRDEISSISSIVKMKFHSSSNCLQISTSNYILIFHLILKNDEEYLNFLYDNFALMRKEFNNDKFYDKNFVFVSLSSINVHEFHQELISPIISSYSLQFPSNSIFSKFKYENVEENLKHSNENNFTLNFNINCSSTLWNSYIKGDCGEIILPHIVYSFPSNYLTNNISLLKENLQNRLSYYHNVQEEIQTVLQYCQTKEFENLNKINEEQEIDENILVDSRSSILDSIKESRSSLRESIRESIRVSGYFNQASISSSNTIFNYLKINQTLAPSISTKISSSSIPLPTIPFPTTSYSHPTSTLKDFYHLNNFLNMNKEQMILNIHQVWGLKSHLLNLIQWKNYLKNVFYFKILSIVKTLKIISSYKLYNIIKYKIKIQLKLIKKLLNNNKYLYINLKKNYYLKKFLYFNYDKNLYYNMNDEEIRQLFENNNNKLRDVSSLSSTDDLSEIDLNQFKFEDNEEDIQYDSDESNDDEDNKNTNYYNISSKYNTKLYNLIKQFNHNIRLYKNKLLNQIKISSDNIVINSSDLNQLEYININNNLLLKKKYILLKHRKFFTKKIVNEFFQSNFYNSSFEKNYYKNYSYFEIDDIDKYKNYEVIDDESRKSFEKLKFNNSKKTVISSKFFYQLIDDIDIELGLEDLYNQLDEEEEEEEFEEFFNEENAKYSSNLNYNPLTSLLSLKKSSIINEEAKSPNLSPSPNSPTPQANLFIENFEDEYDDENKNFIFPFNNEEYYIVKQLFYPSKIFLDELDEEYSLKLLNFIFSNNKILLAIIRLVIKKKIFNVEKFNNNFFYYDMIKLDEELDKEYDEILRKEEEKFQEEEEREKREGEEEFIKEERAEKRMKKRKLIEKQKQQKKKLFENNILKYINENFFYSKDNKFHMNYYNEKNSNDLNNSRMNKIDEEFNEEINNNINEGFDDKISENDEEDLNLFNSKYINNIYNTRTYLDFFKDNSIFYYLINSLIESLSSSDYHILKSFYFMMKKIFLINEYNEEEDIKYEEEERIKRDRAQREREREGKEVDDEDDELYLPSENFLYIVAKNDINVDEFDPILIQKKINERLNFNEELLSPYLNQESFYDSTIENNDTKHMENDEVKSNDEKKKIIILNMKNNLNSILDDIKKNENKLSEYYDLLHNGIFYNILTDHESFITSYSTSNLPQGNSLPYPSYGASNYKISPQAITYYNKKKKKYLHKKKMKNFDEALDEIEKLKKKMKNSNNSVDDEDLDEDLDDENEDEEDDVDMRLKLDFISFNFESYNQSFTGDAVGKLSLYSFISSIPMAKYKEEDIIDDITSVYSEDTIEFEFDSLEDLSDEEKIEKRKLLEKLKKKSEEDEEEEEDDDEKIVDEEILEKERGEDEEFNSMMFTDDFIELWPGKWRNMLSIPNISDKFSFVNSADLPDLPSSSNSSLISFEQSFPLDYHQLPHLYRNYYMIHNKNKKKKLNKDKFYIKNSYLIPKHLHLLTGINSLVGSLDQYQDNLTSSNQDSSFSKKDNDLTSYSNSKIIALYYDMTTSCLYISFDTNKVLVLEFSYHHIRNQIQSQHQVFLVEKEDHYLQNEDNYHHSRNSTLFKKDEIDESTDVSDTENVKSRRSSSILSKRRNSKRKSSTISLLNSRKRVRNSNLLNKKKIQSQTILTTSFGSFHIKLQHEFLLFNLLGGATEIYHEFLHSPRFHTHGCSFNLYSEFFKLSSNDGSPLSRKSFSKRLKEKDIELDFDRNKENSSNYTSSSTLFTQIPPNQHSRLRLLNKFSGEIVETIYSSKVLSIFIFNPDTPYASPPQVNEDPSSTLSITMSKSQGSSTLPSTTLLSTLNIHSNSRLLTPLNSLPMNNLMPNFPYYPTQSVIPFQSSPPNLNSSIQKLYSSSNISKFSTLTSSPVCQTISLKHQLLFVVNQFLINIYDINSMKIIKSFLIPYGIIKILEVFDHPDQTINEAIENKSIKKTYLLSLLCGYSNGYVSIFKLELTYEQYLYDDYRLLDKEFIHHHYNKIVSNTDPLDEEDDEEDYEDYDEDELDDELDDESDDKLDDEEVEDDEGKRNDDEQEIFDLIDSPIKSEIKRSRSKSIKSDSSKLTTKLINEFDDHSINDKNSINENNENNKKSKKLKKKYIKKLIITELIYYFNFSPSPITDFLFSSIGNIIAIVHLKRYAYIIRLNYVELFYLHQENLIKSPSLSRASSKNSTRMSSRLPSSRQPSRNPIFKDKNFSTTFFYTNNDDNFYQNIDPIKDPTQLKSNFLNILTLPDGVTSMKSLISSTSPNEILFSSLFKTEKLIFAALTSFNLYVFDATQSLPIFSLPLKWPSSTMNSPLNKMKSNFNYNTKTNKDLLLSRDFLLWDFEKEKKFENKQNLNEEKRKDSFIENENISEKVLMGLYLGKHMNEIITFSESRGYVLNRFILPNYFQKEKLEESFPPLIPSNVSTNISQTNSTVNIPPSINYTESWNSIPLSINSSPSLPLLTFFSKSNGIFSRIELSSQRGIDFIRNHNLNILSYKNVKKIHELVNQFRIFQTNFFYNIPLTPTSISAPNSIFSSASSNFSMPSTSSNQYKNIISSYLENQLLLTEKESLTFLHYLQQSNHTTYDTPYIVEFKPLMPMSSTKKHTALLVLSNGFAAIISL